MNKNTDLFLFAASIGKQLMDLHLNYDTAPEYPLEWRWTEGVEQSWHVEKMRFNRDRTELVVNASLTLVGIPPRCFEYILGNRSALEWVVDQYQVTRDQRSGIVSDPNNPENPEYIAHHVCRVVYVSMETLRLQDELARVISPDMFVGFEDDSVAMKDMWKRE